MQRFDRPSELSNPLFDRLRVRGLAGLFDSPGGTRGGVRADVPQRSLEGVSERLHSRPLGTRLGRSQFLQQSLVFTDAQQQDLPHQFLIAPDS